VRAFFGVRQDHVERDREHGRDHQHLEHEVVQGREEEREPRLGLQRLSVVVSPLLSPLGEVFASEADLGVDLELGTNFFDAYSYTGRLPPSSPMRTISSSYVRVL